MKQIIIGLVISVALIACKLKKKMNNPVTDFKVVDTEMAEIKEEPVPDIEITKNDTLEFLKFWERFYTHYENNETASIIHLSLDSIICPVYKDDPFSFDALESDFVSIHDFAGAPLRKKYNFKFIPVSRNEIFYIVYNYKYNRNPLNLKLKKDSVLLDYTVQLLSAQSNGNYEILRFHSLSFLRVNNTIKFSGLRIDGGYSRFTNDSTTRANLYFPLYRKTQDSLTNLNALDTFSNLWYSSSLSAFKEPYLYNYKGADEFYRFTWLRSFHNPIVIRFQKQNGNYILSTKEMIDNRGYAPDISVVNSTQHLTASKWNKLESKLSRLNFWNKETHDPDPISATDGAQWILEANIKGKYHFIDRQFPENRYKDCCLYLLFLSRLKIPKEDIY